MTRARSLSLLIPILLAGVGLVQAQPYAYIPNSLEDTVSIIDTATHTLVATVVVGEAPQATVWSPDGTKAYVTVSGKGFANWLTVLDVETHAAIGIIGGLAPGPLGMDISPNGKIFVTGPGEHILPVLCEGWGAMSVVDTATDTVAEVVQLALEQPWGVLAHPTNGKVYGTLSHDERLVIMDAETNQMLENINIGDGCGVGTDHHPVMMAIHPSGNPLYIIRMHSSSLLAFDVNTNQVIGEKDMTEGQCPGLFWCTHPHGIAVHPDGSKVYTANFFQDTISVLDAYTLETIQVVPAGRGAKNLDFTPDGSALYVVNYYDDNVWVMDPDTMELITMIPVGNAPEPTGPFIGPTESAAIAAGSVSGLSARRVTCRNDSKGTQTTINEPGTSWDCVAAGLSVSSGDTLTQIVRAVARSEAPRGMTLGLTVTGVSCKNTTTGQQGFGTMIGTGWSCDPVAFSTGNAVEINIRATVN